MKRKTQADSELVTLVQQAYLSRKLEKDYYSLDQQVRCLNTRQYTQKDLIENEALIHHEKQLLTEYQVDDLELQLNSILDQIKNAKSEYSEMRQEYITMNEKERKMQEEMSEQRKEIAKQMTQNQELERQTKQTSQAQIFVKGQTQETQNEISKLGTLREKANKRNITLVNEIETCTNQINLLESEKS